MRNARFWEWTNDGLVKITLRPGQTLHWRRAWETDEGWTSDAMRWTLDDDTVTRDYVQDGRDCDGRLTHYQTTVCPVWLLKDRPAYENPGYLMPDWQHVDASQCDESAEAAGY